MVLIMMIHMIILLVPTSSPPGDHRGGPERSAAYPVPADVGVSVAVFLRHLQRHDLLPDQAGHANHGGLLPATTFHTRTNEQRSGDIVLGEPRRRQLLSNERGGRLARVGCRLARVGPK